MNHRSLDLLSVYILNQYPSSSNVKELADYIFFYLEIGDIILCSLETATKKSEKTDCWETRDVQIIYIRFPQKQKEKVSTFDSHISQLQRTVYLIYFFRKHLVCLKKYH